MEARAVFSSQRCFIVALYELSHGLLLLRSVKTNEYSTRIDVLFQSVRAMEMRCWFDGVSIAEVDREFLVGFRSNPVEMIEPGNKVYAINGLGWQGYVLGGIVQTIEDERDPRDPSGLMEHR